MEKKNPIKLPKLLYDVSREKSLHPNNLNVTQLERDEAWARVANINGLSCNYEATVVCQTNAFIRNQLLHLIKSHLMSNNQILHETRSIFKVLLKKYEQEKDRPGTSWKLFQLMDNIHNAQMKSESSDNYDDENEEFEMLEVQEEEDSVTSPGRTTENISMNDCETPCRSVNSYESTEKPEKQNANKIQTTTPPREERKVLNSLVSSAIRYSPAVSQQKNNISIKPQKIIKHRGITIKKATPSPSPKFSMATYGTEKKEKTIIQMPEAIKRKILENLEKDNKKIHLSNTTALKASSHQASPINPVRAPTPKLVPQPVTIKMEIEDDLTPGTVITLSNNGSHSTSTKNNIQTPNTSNGFTPSLKDIDFSKDIIFNNHLNDMNSTKNTPLAIKMESDCQSQGLTPTFFKNLCNSSRHEAFGLYVANIMNRLSKTAASKLEVQILRSVTNILSEDIAS